MRLAMPDFDFIGFPVLIVWVALAAATAAAATAAAATAAAAYILHHVHAYTLL